MNLAQSDLRSLAVFRSVVENNGFVGAQVALRMSQSTVSFHMKSLETRLGFALCDRGRGGFRLTERGRLVHMKSTDLFLALNDFESELGGLRDRVVGTLRLGIIDNTLTNDGLPLPRVIDRIRRHAPEATIKITVDDPEVLAVNVSNGQTDVAITPETKPVGGVRTSPLYTEQHSLFCARSHPLFHLRDDEVTIERVESHPFVARTYGRLRELEYFPNADVGALADHIEIQAMFILSGGYLGYLPDHVAAERLRDGSLRRLLGSQTSISSQFMLVTRAGRRSTGLMDLFVRELIVSLSEVFHRGS